MPGGPKITDNVKRIIAQVWLEHQDWVAKEIMREVHERLRKDNPNVPPNWPKLTAIQVEIKKTRDRHENRPPEIKDLDKPWSILSLAKYPIHPEALPTVLKVWVYRRETSNSPFSIRDALWTGRLYTLTKDIRELSLMACSRSLYEQLMESSGGSLIGPDTYHDLKLYEIVTGKELTLERENKIFGVIKEDWLKWRDGLSPRDIQKIEDYEKTRNYAKSIEQTMTTEKEAKNERPHNQEG
ncbi:MAG: hypothetical protein PHQ43_05165 [Dehalococcoidales bacterium]|nr:hypothetical protein [Dehalococcoidales bacterium]